MKNWELIQISDICPLSKELGQGSRYYRQGVTLMMLPLKKENYAKKTNGRRWEANSSPGANVAQRMGFWLQMHYRQNFGKKPVS